MKKALLTGVFAVGVMSAAQADIPPPPPNQNPGQGVRLNIVQSTDGQAVLELPRSLQKNATKSSEAPAGTRTVLAGLFLSLGLVGGGLWAARRRAPVSVTTASLVLGGLALGAAGTTAWANIAPPRYLREDVKVQVRWTSGPDVRLHVNRDQFQLLSQKYGRTDRFLPSSPAPTASPAGAQPPR